jgi:acetoacetyl-CoA synthetase
MGCSYAPQQLGRALPLVQLHRLGDVERADQRPAGGTTCVIFDGNPGGSKEHPTGARCGALPPETGVTFFGAGAAFYANCMKAGVDLPAQCGDLSRIRALGTTGSPLSPEVQQWGTAQFARAGEAQTSGGATSRAAPTSRRLHRRPPRAAAGARRDAVPHAGRAVEAWNEQGQPVLDEVGELVCTQPIPSMPLYLWGDTDGARYSRATSTCTRRATAASPAAATARPAWAACGAMATGSDRQPGHGSTGCVIYGRSDATINRHGLRMGTSELYSAVEALPEVLDSLVVDLEYLGRESYMPLFVVLRPGRRWTRRATINGAMRARINGAIRTALSPRFVPDDIFAVAEVPRTLWSGKKQELPIKKLLLGQPHRKRW